MAKLSFTCRFSAVVIGVLASLAVVSCESRGTDEAMTYAAYPNMTNPNFSQLSAAVLIPKCVSCHSEFRDEQSLLASVSPGDPDHSALFQMVESGQMPKGGAPLPASLVNMIRAYIMTASQGPVIDLNNVTFATLDSDLIGPRCLKCHQEFSTEEGVLSDVEPGFAQESILYNMVASGAMPKGGHLSQNGIDAIGAFINSLPPKTYPPIAPTFRSLQANLFERSCVQCHSAGRMAEKEPFDTWDGVTDYDTEILKKMQDPKRPMPPAHTTLKPSAAVIQAYSDWLNAGEPNN